MDGKNQGNTKQPSSSQGPRGTKRSSESPELSSSSAEAPPIAKKGPGSISREDMAGTSSSKAMELDNQKELTPFEGAVAVKLELLQMILSLLDVEELLVARRVSRTWAQISSRELTTRSTFVIPFNFGDTEWRKGYSKTQTLPAFIELLEGSSSRPWDFPFVRFHLNFSDFGGSDFGFDMGKGKGDKNKKTEELPGSLLQFYAAHCSRIKYLGFDADRHTSSRAIRCMKALVQLMVTPTSTNPGARALEELDFSGWDAVFTVPMGIPLPKSAIGALANLKTLQFGPLGSDQRGYFLDWILQAAQGLKDCKYVASNPVEGYGHDSGRYVDWSLFRAMKKLDLITEATIIIGHGIIQPGVGKVISSARFLNVLSITLEECGASDWKEVQKILEACKGSLESFRVRPIAKVHAGFKFPTLPQLKTLHFAGYTESALTQLTTASASVDTWPKLESVMLYGPLTGTANETSGPAKGKGKKKATKTESVVLTAFANVRKLVTGLSNSYTAIARSFPNLKHLVLLRDHDDDEDEEDEEENTSAASEVKGKFNPKLWTELNGLGLEVLQLPMLLTDSELTGIPEHKCKELKGKKMADVNVEGERNESSILQLKGLKRLGLWADKMSSADINSTLTEVGAIFGFRMMTPPVVVGVSVSDLSSKNRKTELEELSVGPFVTFV